MAEYPGIPFTPSIGVTFDRRAWEMRIQVDRMTDNHAPNCPGGEHCCCQEASYVLRIRRGGDEDQFTQIVQIMGDEFIGATVAERRDMMESILLNEPVDEAAASDSVDNRTVLLSKRDKLIFEHMRRHWDAFTLLFRPMVL